MYRRKYPVGPLEPSEFHTPRPARTPEEIRVWAEAIEARCALMFPINDQERRVRRNHLARERRAHKKATQMAELKALLQITAEQQ